MARFKLKLVFLSWLVAVFLVSTCNGQQVGTNCTDPRVRRSWDTYTATEKSLYLEAVGIAMDKGLHQKFVQVHTEYMSEKEAHGNCMFIYWHRILLLGYENMLRNNITIRGFAYDGKTVVNVWQDPKNILYPFFKDLPYKYADYVDAKDLGNYSYTYAMSGGLATFYQKCWTSTEVSATTTLLADERQHRVRGGDTGDLYPIIEPGTTYDEKVKRWNIALYEAARIVGYEEEAAKDQMEMVMCQYQEDCLGGVVDYTDLFRANFGVEGHPRCYTLLQYLDSGDRVIGIPQWKAITNRFLPCSAYKKKDTPVSDFAKAVSELKKGLGGGKSPDNYVSATYF
ncbi:hypothetical protein JG687_00015575 [Phytophthora cactorum]|uniref:Tyrosinase copper-binding domain-containing protein n=1 Tax=Phytophthora cactorum TaxID=29920 RepID=A0A8T1TUM8_9STRA|nr:hypothetical protein JG687_00015575 [Phytophthora cactorum]